MSKAYNADDSDSDADSIATTTLYGLLDIDEFFSKLDPNASPFVCHRQAETIRMKVRTSIARMCTYTNHPAVWQEFVRSNQDIFYPWVEFLPPQLVAIRGTSFITDAMRFKIGGTKVKRSTVHKVMRRLYPDEILGENVHFHMLKNHRFDKRLSYPIPALRKLVTRVDQKDVHDVWYEMNQAERNSVKNFLFAIGVSWVDEHLV